MTSEEATRAMEDGTGVETTNAGKLYSGRITQAGLGFTFAGQEVDGRGEIIDILWVEPRDINFSIRPAI